jgi:hypothetical protein
MEKDGVVESSWETARPGPARRMYTITDAGEAYLASGRGPCAIPAVNGRLFPALRGQAAAHGQELGRPAGDTRRIFPPPRFGGAGRINTLRRGLPRAGCWHLGLFSCRHSSECVGGAVFRRVRA